MRILIADDDAVCREVLGHQLKRWGHELVVATDGEEAFAQLTPAGAPLLAILDWMMPKLDGVEVCKRVRAASPERLLYLILLSARSQREDIVEGLDAGANDYIVKPFHSIELRARIGVGIRIIEVELQLAQQLKELREALAQVRTLQGLLPICAWCKKIRDDQQYWQTLESYLGKHTEARFTHCICPECLAKQKRMMASQQA